VALFNRNLSYDQALRNLDQERWNNLNLRGRVQTLQSVENEMAARQGREPCKVEAAKIGRAGEDQAAGAYDPGTKKIYVNSELLYYDENYKSDIKEHIDTVLHEGRHAYQDQAVNAEIEHPNREEVYLWAENNHNYINDQENIRAYYNQPVEKDAYGYSEEMTRQVLMERDGAAREAQSRPQGKDAFAEAVKHSGSRSSDAGAEKEAFLRQSAQVRSSSYDTGASRAAFSSQAGTSNSQSNGTAAKTGPTNDKYRDRER
jgi:hypothetical protein